MKTPLDSLLPAARLLARHSAVIALALFAAVGALVLDDYGVSADEGWQRSIGIASFNYILGVEDALIEEHHNRFYGVAFELPLIAIERALGLENSRAIYLSRHITTHVFFLVGGFFAWLLAYRLFGSRLVALLAMLLFLLHPRIYAHSFFNTKDLPFLSMFMIALYLTHRAFRRDSVWAFALCGVGVGLLVNIRIMGVTLFPAVLGMLALDAFFAVKREAPGGIKPALVNAGGFVAAFAAALYAAWPLLWSEPLGVVEALATLSQHPAHIPTLFRGEIVHWPNLPWDYIPTWALITTPPVALALAAIGAAYLARLCAARWRDIFENSTARFGLLAAACLILPVAAAILLNSNLYNGWRQMYFLYAPLCVLAAFGLRRLAALPKPRLRAAAFALAAVGIALTVAEMVRLHPYQNEYFSPMVDKSGIADRYEMDYWHVSYREAFETLAKMEPNGRVAVTEPVDHARLLRNIGILPEDDRGRFFIAPEFPSFLVVEGDGAEAAVWTREVYGAPIVSLIDARAETAAAFRSAYATATASAPVAGGGGFDIYLDGDTLTYVKENCGEEDTRVRFSLRVLPADQAKRESFNFDFPRYGAILDGKCVIIRDLPDYPISHIITGQRTDEEGALWSAGIISDGFHERYRRALASLSSSPVASGGGFDIYREGDTLTYVKEGCGEEDTRGRFALSVYPVDRNDLPQSARDAGLDHEPLNFDFAEYGAIFDGKCAVIRDLPEYPISHIETGQWTSDEGGLWSARIVLDGFHERYRRALAALSDDPNIRSDFDVYMEDGALIYVKSPCAEGDTRGRFALSVYPADPSDLQKRARDAGLEHEPLNFNFAEYGAIFDGKCAIIRRLPSYPIGSIETGQWIPGEGELWSGRVAVGD